jgi:hypothetical protein
MISKNTLGNSVLELYEKHQYSNNRVNITIIELLRKMFGDLKISLYPFY